jgi:hypothetical protein
LLLLLALEPFLKFLVFDRAVPRSLSLRALRAGLFLTRPFLNARDDWSDDPDAFVFRLGAAPAAYCISPSGDGSLTPLPGAGGGGGGGVLRHRFSSVQGEDGRVPVCAALVTDSLLAFGGSRASTAVAFTIRADFERGNLYGLPLLPDPLVDQRAAEAWLPSARGGVDTVFVVTAAEAFCFVDAVGETMARHARFKARRI